MLPIEKTLVAEGSLELPSSTLRSKPHRRNDHMLGSTENLQGALKSLSGSVSGRQGDARMKIDPMHDSSYDSTLDAILRESNIETR